MQYASEGVPLVVLAGKEYGSGSSRDWAAKGSLLLGVRAVLVESFERIHRSNLVGHGRAAAGVPRRRVGRVARAHRPRDLPHRRLGSARRPTVRCRATVTVHADDRQFPMRARIDTPFELEVFLDGGILPYTLRRLAQGSTR